MQKIDELLAFWFGIEGDIELGHMRDMWFKNDPAFDALVRFRFGALHSTATAEELDRWKATPRGCLALIVLLDQFSRNLYRGSSRAFACDAQALSTAQQTIDAGFDLALFPIQRMFVYMPFQHSEDLEQQRRSLRLFASLRAEPGMEICYEYAVRHFEAIARFGRFPHRNSILGRISTPEELEYLQEPGAGF